MSHERKRVAPGALQFLVDLEADAAEMFALQVAVDPGCTIDECRQLIGVAICTPTDESPGIVEPFAVTAEVIAAAGPYEVEMWLNYIDDTAVKLFDRLSLSEAGEGPTLEDCRAMVADAFCRWFRNP